MLSPVPVSAPLLTALRLQPKQPRRSSSQGLQAGKRAHRLPQSWERGLPPTPLPSVEKASGYSGYFSAREKACLVLLTSSKGCTDGPFERPFRMGSPQHLNVRDSSTSYPDLCSRLIVSSATHTTPEEQAAFF